MHTSRFRAGLIGATLIGLAAAGGLSLSVANAADVGQQYSGCLKNGTLSNVAIGSTPSAKCLTHTGGPIALHCKGGVAEISNGTLVVTRVTTVNQDGST